MPGSPSTDDSAGDETDDPAGSAQDFYTRWARLYDLLATHGPGVRALRERAVQRLAPRPGDTVVDLGCGTGATLPLLREAVGPDGRVVGIDFAPGPARVASERASEWSNVHVLRGDATQPPLSALSSSLSPDSPDAILASFVVGMLADPGAVVRRWADLVGSDGRLALLDLARSTGLPGRLLNPGFALATRLSAPPGTAERHGSPTRVLDERVAEAHWTLFEVCADVERSTHALGFVRLSGGRVE